MVLYFLVLATSCIFNEFPLTNNDIDTLSVYYKYRDSLALNTINKTDNTNDTLKSSSLTEVTVGSPKERWTICTGVFRLKQNAKRSFNKLNKKTGAYLLIRGKFNFITTGVFDNRDSALIFQKDNITSDSYLLKILPNEMLIQTFPE